MRDNIDGSGNTRERDRFSEEKQDLEDIGVRLRSARENRDKPSKLSMRIKAPPGNALGLAFRVSVELVSALAVGLATGWLLDQWLDTRPWLMLALLLLGGSAGILNVYRMAKGMGYADGYGDKTKEEDAKDSS
jgi:ATP synthase protein I